MIGGTANLQVTVPLRSSSAYERYSVFHDPNDMATQTESVVYLVHEQESLRERAGEVVESMGLAAQTIESTEEFLDAYDDARDSCLITDLVLHDKPIDDLFQAMEDQSIAVPAIILTNRADVRSAVKIMRRGAVNLLEDPFLEDELRASIQDAIEKDAVERQANLRRHAIHSGMESLSDKERTVLDLVVAGMANKVIAKRLGVSIRTVESRRQAVFQKMNVSTLAALVRVVVEAELGDR